MIFSDSFTQVLDKLSNQVEDKRQKLGKNKLNDVIELSVEAWCGEINIPNDKNISQIVHWWHQPECTNLITEVFTQYQSGNSIFINYTKNIFKMDKITEVKFILLIAFVLTGVGCLLYYSRPQSSQKEQKQLGGSTAPGQQSALSPDRKTWILVLIINAEKENILQSLKLNGRVMLNEGEKLYRATQALWVGSKTELFKSRLGNCFSNNLSMQESDKSEYDVCFVQIEIDKPDRGFAPNANQLDRIDAFRNLPKNAKKVIVSPRLPSKAYENTDVYSR